MSDWIQTFTGKQFYPLEPRLEDIDIVDIAHSLSMQCRFGGHCREFYSVAQHCLNVSDLCPPYLKLAGLLHDAAEAYLCDLPSPVKRDKDMEAYRRAEFVLMRFIGEKFGVETRLWDLVKQFDQDAFTLEAWSLFPVHMVRQWKYVGLDEGERLTECLSPALAKNAFLTLFRELRG